jgi:hypothetical protein
MTAFFARRFRDRSAAWAMQGKRGRMKRRSFRWFGIALLLVCPDSWEQARAGGCGDPKAAFGSAERLESGAPREPRFLCPMRGIVVISCWKENDDEIAIAAPPGTAVRAAGDGTVAYVGSQLKGFGNLIAIRHPLGFVSLYAHVGTPRVTRGRRVSRGEVIATMANDDRDWGSQLVFQLRSRGHIVSQRRYVSCR